MNRMMSDTERTERLQDLAAACSRLQEIVQRIRENPALRTERMLADVNRYSHEVARQAFGYTIGDSQEFADLKDREVIPGVIDLGVAMMTRDLFHKGETAQSAHDLVHGSVELAFHTAVIELVAEQDKETAVADAVRVQYP